MHPSLGDLGSLAPAELFAGLYILLDLGQYIADSETLIMLSRTRRNVTVLFPYYVLKVQQYTSNSLQE